MQWHSRCGAHLGSALLSALLPALLSALLLALLAGCAAPPVLTAVGGLRLIGVQHIASGLTLDGTVVGGLSGIDYDDRSQRWILISDDRSEHGPARYYSAQLSYDLSGFHAVTLQAAHTLRQPDGRPYAAAELAAHGGTVADFEAIRFDPQGPDIWYTSEGYGKLGIGASVQRAATDGSYHASLPLPPLLQRSADGRSGPRDNLSFEGLAFSQDGQTLWLGMEAPLHQDGQLATPQHGAVTRLTQFDRSGKLSAQFAYPLDRVQAEPASGRWADNGVSDILVIDAQHLLVLERSGVQDGAGRFVFYCRLYSVELAGATDISHFAALDDASYIPLRKRLLLNFNSAGLGKVDNLEGMAWGPLLANGHRSLVLISDDNFSADQVTQLWVFDVF